MANYYNEIDPFAAEWLRNLIKANLIAPGDVDTRDIRDVVPTELVRYTQCHFFAGIGLWSLAFRLAGLPDTFRAWSGSCPCQPFSTAGAGAGFADERHLWPHWFHLIRVLRPDLVFGEQVASQDALDWIDLVHADMEGEGYAIGEVDLCAAGVGAPHIRNRLWWVADATGNRRGQERQVAGWRGSGSGTEGLDERPAGGGIILPGSVAHAHASGFGAGGREGLHRAGRPGALAAHGGRSGELADPDSHGRDQGRGGVAAAGHDGLERDGRPGVALGDTSSQGLPAREREGLRGEGRGQEGRAVEQPGLPSGALGHADSLGAGRIAGAVRGAEDGEGGRGRGDDARAPSRADREPTFWDACDWIPCRDGKARPVEPGVAPLVTRRPGHVGQLRAYGNSINAEAAAEVVRAWMRCAP